MKTKNQYIKEVDDLTDLEKDQLAGIQAGLRSGQRPPKRPNYWQEMYEKFWQQYELNRRLK
jgi:hypothetical protein